MFDFHSHILPNIDDGSQSISQSLAMLSILANSHVQAVVATPHYYINQHSIESFLEKRDSAFEQLKSNADLSGYPKIVLGAEVLLTSELAEQKNLPKLCIQNTNYILIEMPYTYWTDWIYLALNKIIADHNLIPIIAHIDRYVDFVKDKKKIDRLLYMDVIAQMNANAIVERKTQRKALKLIKSGKIQLLGSDAHDDTERAPRLSEAVEIIKKKIGQSIVDEFNENAKYILKNSISL